MVGVKTLYRQLIEENGGTFDHNDGYLRKGTKEIENQIRKADVVLFPMNCNSHGAFSAVKRFGKKYSKPVRVLATSSLTAISYAVFGEES